MSLEQILAALGLALCLGLLLWGFLSPGRKQALVVRSHLQQRHWLGFRQRLKARFTLMRWQLALLLRRGRQSEGASRASSQGASGVPSTGARANPSRLSAQREAQALITRLRSGGGQLTAPKGGEAGAGKPSGKPDKPGRPTQH